MVTSKSVKLVNHIDPKKISEKIVDVHVSEEKKDSVGKFLTMKTKKKLKVLKAKKFRLALAAWYSGHGVNLQNRRSRVRIPPGCKVFLKCVHDSAVVLT
jgi:hypothetical protein